MSATVDATQSSSWRLQSVEFLILLRITLSCVLSPKLLEKSGESLNAERSVECSWSQQVGHESLASLEPCGTVRSSSSSLQSPSVSSCGRTSSFASTTRTLARTLGGSISTCLCSESKVCSANAPRPSLRLWLAAASTKGLWWRLRHLDSLNLAFFLLFKMFYYKIFIDKFRLPQVPYAFIQPNGSWCWSNAGFMASLNGAGLDRSLPCEWLLSVTCEQCVRALD